MSLPQIKLLPGREKSLLRRHPWVFSGAIAGISGSPRAGETCLVVDSRGTPLAVAAYSPASQITARIWSSDPDEPYDGKFSRRRIPAPAQLRETLGFADIPGGARLIYSESDGLPGVIADRYGNFVALQILSAGAEFFRQEIAECILELPGIAGVYERSDVSVRKHEKLPERCGLAAGEALPPELIIQEGTRRFAVDPIHGQKTGFYFDLRDARDLVTKLSAGRRVLNGFCYTGGFAVAALQGGATAVVNIDSSRPALAQARKNLELNNLDLSRAEWIAADGFEELNRQVKAGEKFDLVILDPPKLIDAKSHVISGCRAYSHLARRGFELLNPGGLLLNLSCSGLMTPELLQKITADAACQCGVEAQLVGEVRQSADHPVLLSVPETFYLKGLLSIRR